MNGDLVAALRVARAGSSGRRRRRGRPADGGHIGLQSVSTAPAERDDEKRGSLFRRPRRTKRMAARDLAVARGGPGARLRRPASFARACAGRRGPSRRHGLIRCASVEKPEQVRSRTCRLRREEVDIVRQAHAVRMPLANRRDLDDSPAVATSQRLRSSMWSVKRRRARIPASWPSPKNRSTSAKRSYPHRMTVPSAVSTFTATGVRHRGRQASPLPANVSTGPWSGIETAAARRVPARRQVSTARFSAQVLGLVDWHALRPESERDPALRFEPRPPQPVTIRMSDPSSGRRNPMAS